jgi:hypothetical protein
LFVEKKPRKCIFQCSVKKTQEILKIIDKIQTAERQESKENVDIPFDEKVGFQGEE